MTISRRGFIRATVSLGALVIAASKGLMPFSKEDSKKQLLSDKFYGGTDNVRKILADSLKEAREKKGVSQEDLDKDCMLGYTGSVRCNEYESDYRCITPFTFSLVSSHFRMHIDEVLHKDLSPSDIEYIVANMEMTNIISNKSPEAVSKEFIPVYFYLKVMEELEQEKRTKAA